jgi:hypothetical protein
VDRLDEIKKRLDEVREKRGRVDPRGETWRDMTAWAVAEIEQLRALLHEAADRLDDADSHELVRRITYALCGVP